MELLTENIDQLSSEDIQTLININNPTWQATKRTIKTALNRILIQGIPQGLPEEIKKKTVVIQLGNSIPEETKSIAVQILLNSLQPNLEINEQETKKRAERAAQAIKPVTVSIQKGRVIVDVGEKITQSQFVLLDGFGLSRRSVNWMEIGLSGLLVTSSVIIFLAIAKQAKGKLRRRDYILLWLLGLTIPAIAIFKPRYTSLAGVGFLMSSFYGPTLAITNVSLMTGLVLFQTGGASWEYLVAAYAGSILASLMASRLHSREELALLGGGVGLIQGGVYLIINLIISATAGTIWYAVLPGAIVYGLIGVAYSVIALGISPYLERCFDLVTPIRLAELSNTNRPLLKRLALEAPGTFQHTMFVASLAEAAARELHCNVELVRAGTLYHDIGKMHDPQGFIENQMGGPNKHDQIKDPFISAEIIKKHVSEGLVMARKYGLPKAIRDFIPEHQGTLLISYFYFQAKNQGSEKGLKSFNEDDFRYDGPIPQSRETGIVMLADGCEAALRSLKDPNPDQALAVIQKIFKARWRDNQLAESGLKYEELPVIAEIFVRVWQQFNHQRIAYPKAALETRLSIKN
jgi:putative nucleotidyltransferase with HDIG domain